jgi:arginine deiminase
MHHDEYFNYTDNDAQTAIYDYTEAGHLKLFYEKDDQFTAILRKIVPAGFISWSKKTILLGY